MRTILTAEDLKRLLAAAFKENTEQISLTDEDGDTTVVDLCDYLNVQFYTWKNRLENATGDDNFDSWVESITLSMNKAFALVSLTDSDIMPSTNIDFNTVMGEVKFIIQASKAPLLEYLCAKVRANTAGVPIEFINSNGETRVGFINSGILLYDEEPQMSQYGEVVVCTINVSFGILSDAATYEDERVELSLDGTNFSPLVYTKYTFKLASQTNPVATVERPDLTGQVVSSLFVAVALTFYDYKDTLVNALNSVVMGACAARIGDDAKEVGDVNIPIYLKITSKGVVYEYKTVLTAYDKGVTNGEYTICSMTLALWGKGQ